MHRFGNWICFRLQGERREITLLGPYLATYTCSNLDMACVLESVVSKLPQTLGMDFSCKNRSMLEKYKCFNRELINIRTIFRNKLIKTRQERNLQHMTLCI
jgi:hypothetical protein